MRGHVADLEARRFRPAELTVADGRIARLTELPPDALPPDAPWLIPGFVDAHVHVESSLLTPAEFARLAVAHGTVGTVSDPHEIANVLGVAGVQFMLADAGLRLRVRRALVRTGDGVRDRRGADLGGRHQYAL